MVTICIYFLNLTEMLNLYATNAKVKMHAFLDTIDWDLEMN